MFICRMACICCPVSDSLFMEEWAVVLDPGHTVRAGFAGDEEPTYSTPSIVGKVLSCSFCTNVQVQ